jgi:eukaryotic-like serine/threonine-protein kinase
LFDEDDMLDRVIAGRFAILGRLGDGGFGRIYLAEQLQLRRRVAIKILRCSTGQSAGRANRFLAEARIASRLDHPHCIRILDFGREQDLLFLAVELLQGIDLGTEMARIGRFSPGRACRIMIQVASALAFMHAKGILYRDMKPSSIMLIEHESDTGPTSDWVKVCDFGLAKFLVSGTEPCPSGSPTLKGLALGTPAFMSPEQARGEVLDPRSDIFSWGVLFYAMLSGRLPFRARARADVPWIHEVTPRALSAVVPSIDPELDRIVAHAMETDREKRCPSARELIARLQAHSRRMGTIIEEDAKTMVELEAAPQPLRRRSLPVQRGETVSDKRCAIDRADTLPRAATTHLRAARSSASAVRDVQLALAVLLFVIGLLIALLLIRWP